MNKQTPQQRQYERRKGQPKITGLYISHEEKALLDAAVAISGGIKAAIFDGLRLVVADQEKSAAWISVNDRLPDELESVLSFSNYDGIHQSIYRSNAFKKNLVVWSHEKVTHWMPLPPPPESTK